MHLLSVKLCASAVDYSLVNPFFIILLRVPFSFDIFWSDQQKKKKKLTPNGDEGDFLNINGI